MVYIGAALPWWKISHLSASLCSPPEQKMMTSVFCYCQTKGSIREFCFKLNTRILDLTWFWRTVSFRSQGGVDENHHQWECTDWDYLRYVYACFCDKQMWLKVEHSCDCGLWSMHQKGCCLPFLWNIAWELPAAGHLQHSEACRPQAPTSSTLILVVRRPQEKDMGFRANSFPGSLFVIVLLKTEVKHMELECFIYLLNSESATNLWLYM